MRRSTTGTTFGFVCAVLLAGLLVPSCHGKGGNGRKGLDHELKLSAIAPEEGPATGGTDVLIIGFNFQQDGPITEVLFGTEPAASFDVQSNNQIFAVTPAHPPGRVDVVVHNLDGDEARLTDAFEFLPVMRDCLTLDPASGPEAGGTPVTIETANFSDDFTVSPPFVYFDTAEATSVTPLDATTVIAVTPPDPNPLPSPGIRPVDVTVESADGFETCTFPLGFTYVSPQGPCMMLQPASGPLSGGTTVAITSLGPCFWSSNSTVTFGGAPATNVVVISGTALECDTPPGTPPAGPVDVEVTGGTPTDPCTCTLPDGFTYLSRPNCLDLDPTSGPIAGGTPVTIRTSGFSDDFTVYPPIVWFDTAQATNVTPLDGTTVVVTTPPDPNPDPQGLDRPVDVMVETTGTAESCLFPSGFTYVTPPAGPCLTVDPNEGALAGGNTVTIRSLGGCRFDPSPAPPTVEFDGIPAWPITIVDSTTLTCTVPAGRQPGPVDVHVAAWDPVGPCDCTAPDAYTYR